MDYAKLTGSTEEVKRAVVVRAELIKQLENIAKKALASINHGGETGAINKLKVDELIPEAIAIVQSKTTAKWFIETQHLRTKDLIFLAPNAGMRITKVEEMFKTRSK